MVTSITGTGTTTTSSTSATSSSSSSSETNSDYLTFLRMLTTQVQNQDPLNPMDSTDFAVQLATFSGVEQQVQTNVLLEQLLDSWNGSQIGQYSDWIGREAQTTGPVWFDGETLSLQASADAGADSATLVVLDSSGNEVSRESVDITASGIEWQGLDANGRRLPDGLYQFQLESCSNGEVIGRSGVAAYSEVTGVEMSQQGPVLVLRGDSAILVENVTGLRDPA